MDSPLIPDRSEGRSPKRLRLWEPERTQRNGLLSDDATATFPLSIPQSYPMRDSRPDPIDDILSSSPPATIPTQIIGTPQRAAPVSVVQVAASSPVIKESPLKPRSAPDTAITSPAPPSRPSYIVKIDLDDDVEVPYAGDSSEDEGSKSQDRKPNIAATTFYHSKPKDTSASISPSSVRVPESPLAKADPVSNMRSYAGQFTFNAAKRPDFSAAADLAKMTAKHLRTQTRPLPPQRGPAVPRSAGVIDLTSAGPIVEKLKKEFSELGHSTIIEVLPTVNYDYNRARTILQKHQLETMGLDSTSLIPKLTRIFPKIDMSEIVAAVIKHNGDMDETAEYLKERDVIVLDDDIEIRTSMKRNSQRGPSKTIREKFSHFKEASPSIVKPTTPKPSPIKAIPPSPAQSDPSPVAPRRRRLIRGSDLRKVESSSESEPEAIDLVTSEEEQEDEPVPVARGPSKADRIETAVLDYINSTDVAGLIDLSFTDAETAETLLALRPFDSLDDIREITVPGNGPRSRPKPIGQKVVEHCITTWQGYVDIDSLLKECSALGKKITSVIESWGVSADHLSGKSELDLTGAAADGGSSPLGVNGHSGLSQKMGSLMSGQPELMADNVQLRSHQILGVNWLKLLHDQGLSGILADEMGLGKTCQVIAFLALLFEQGMEGPHLIVVPASTLENWLREFRRFCPKLRVEPYYGTLAEKAASREYLDQHPGFNVIITTYTMFQGTSRNNKIDMGFLRGFRYDVAVFDEGHQLKNSNSNRSAALNRLKSNFRLLLTGTPLQNNLQELMNLLAFILPRLFEGKESHLNALFKYKAKTTDSTTDGSKLLSWERVKRAKGMMAPFILRRRKNQVLKDLPEKFKETIRVDMTPYQAKVYQRVIESANQQVAARGGAKVGDIRTNVLMKLRQAAIHPLLSRNFYEDSIISEMARALKKHADYGELDFEDVVADLEILNDFELNGYCQKYPKLLGKYELQNDEWMDSAKVIELKRIILDAKQQGDRVLVFSQFTLVLDILERVLDTIEIAYLRLDGSTEVAVRQDLIDEFEEDENITAFILSTKAGGVGLNLAAANRVVIFDSSFNPFDDLQAEDRAWRIGQTKDVYVTRLTAKGTVEEKIARLAETKLKLDASISGEDQEAGNRIASELEKSLFNEIFETDE
ncbi:hypothetical protein ABW19_dt0209406 [Dactylella cylindrospora]|nr:hypothetical protein ABW19_dt0209406 [Dactylella cylindrospora]